MQCIARVTDHGGIRECGRITPANASYCLEHSDRPLIHAERTARHAEITSRIARARKACTLPKPISRPRAHIHDSLAHVEDYIDSVRYYGRTAHDTTLHMLDTFSATINRRILDNTLDGFSLKAIERDMDRLIERSRGKLLASAQRMQARERTQAHKGTHTGTGTSTGTRTLSLSDIRIARAART